MSRRQKPNGEVDELADKLTKIAEQLQDAAEQIEKLVEERKNGQENPSER